MSTIVYEGTTYWAFSRSDNFGGLLLVGFDGSGKTIQQISVGGDRYWNNATIDTNAKTITFIGQSSNVTMVYEPD